MTKGKNKKMKIMKIYLFLLPPSFVDTWVSGQRVGKLTEWESKQKSKNGKRGNLKGGLQQPPPPS